MTADQEKLLELGLNFSITPRKFPLLEYIAAAEDLCQSLEGFGDDEWIEKEQKIRNVMIDHINKGVGMKMKELTYLLTPFSHNGNRQQKKKATYKQENENVLPLLWWYKRLWLCNEEVALI